MKAVAMGKATVQTPQPGLDQPPGGQAPVARRFGAANASVHSSLPGCQQELRCNAAAITGGAPVGNAAASIEARLALAGRRVYTGGPQALASSGRAVLSDRELSWLPPSTAASAGEESAESGEEEAFTDDRIPRCRQRNSPWVPQQQRLTLGRGDPPMN
jgi:hypothetical protein